MKCIGQMMVVTSAILFGACFDGYAFGMYGFGGLIIRLVVCSCTLAAGLAVEKKAAKCKQVKRKRTLRAGTRKAHKNNKYEVICHR